jgi:hypothetical protein
MTETIPVYSRSGFDSVSAKYQLKEACWRAFAYQGRQTVILHLGDYDPSGESIFNDGLVEDIYAFLARDVPHKEPHEVAVFERVALKVDHIERFELAADLARERYEIEARAEANMDALLGTLTELATLDGRQRRQRHLAGREQAHAEHPLDRTLYDWLSARLGGVHGYLGLSISPGTEGRPLYELDALAVAPKRL